MNELLEQFLIECRELAQQATRDLLALEAAPRDTALIDGVFRGFHTLKGAAGIVEFPAMGRMLHEAETMLADARTGARDASAELIGDCLASLDQLEQWLDEIEATGELPPSPDAAAASVIARFARADAQPDEAAGLSPVQAPASPPAGGSPTGTLQSARPAFPADGAPPPDGASLAHGASAPAGSSQPPATASPETPDWVAALLRRHPDHPPRSVLALRYEPDG